MRAMHSSTHNVIAASFALFALPALSAAGGPAPSPRIAGPPPCCAAVQGWLAVLAFGLADAGVVAGAVGEAEIAPGGSEPDALELEWDISGNPDPPPPPQW